MSLNMSIDLKNIKFEQIPELVGCQTVSDWLRVDTLHLDSFEHASYRDQNSASFGQALYPSGLVEGFHLVALLDHLSNQVLRTDPASCTGWNYGLEKVRFVTPVTTEDDIRLKLEIEHVRPKGEGFVLTLGATVEHSESNRPAFIADWLVYWLPVKN